LAGLLSARDWLATFGRGSETRELNGRLPLQFSVFFRGRQWALRAGLLGCVVFGSYLLKVSRLACRWLSPMLLWVGVILLLLCY